MDRLRPGRYEAHPRSSSSSSQTSSIASSSSCSRHTPLTSPSLSEAEHDASDSSGWHSFGASSTAASSQGLSPLELLVQRGKQVQHDIWKPEVDAAHSGKSRIFERATALSPKISVKQVHIQPSPDPDDFDDAQSIRSINLRGHAPGSGTFSVSSKRRSSGSRQEVISSDKSQWRTARELAYDDHGGSLGPQRFSSASSSAQPSTHGDQGEVGSKPWQRESEHLLGNAFRNSVASDISFNSITGQDDRMSLLGQLGARHAADEYSSDLSRRDSVDTVRSSEFDEDGRWGRAWANKADDEESIYGESIYGGDDHDGSRSHWRPDHFSLMSKELEIDPDKGVSTYGFGSGSKLDNITSQWKASHNQAASSSAAQLQVQQQRQQRQQLHRYQQQGQALAQQPHLASATPLPQIHSIPAKEHVVNLTRSAPGRSIGSLMLPDVEATHRRSFIPSIYESDAGIDSQDTMFARDVDQTPLAGSQRQLGHRANDSTSTLDSNGARVYVYPPSPSGSEASRGSGGYDGGGGGRSGQADIPLGSRAVVETMQPGIPQHTPADHSRGHTMYHAEAKPRGPVAPSNILSQPPDSPILAQPGRRPRTSGHPAGRPPPPTPDAPSMQPSFSSDGYADPNQSSPGAMARPVLGRARTEAIAAANGRASIVSDLDVETLRLDASTRRDSTSTINSIMTSRMSVGTVRYEDIGLSAATAPASNDTDAPSKAAWDSTARLRPGNLPSPRRSFSSPNEGAFDHPLPNPTRNNSYPVPGSADAGAHSAHPIMRTQPSHASLDTRPGARPGTAAPGTPRASAPPLRQAKSLAALTAASSNGGSNASGSLLAPSSLAGSATMKPSLSAHSDSSAMTSSARSTKSHGTDTRTGPSTAEDFLSQGITYHEQGDLSRSAFYFERSARVDGGCVVGMCMFGMALREGWGARKDPRKGFEWIQRAAAKAGEMMQGGGIKSESEIKAIKSELKLSVYELGKCFCYGWGVKMDKAMALEYFELAAKLGDADAQAEAGALYASGKGCKKDLKKAAMYYRMAEAGGYDTVGLSWIHKDKYK
ncbi:hypothetical protein ACQY0O_004687 [Thecaphora frezii]